MKQAPLIFKLIINFIAYLGYTLLLSVIFSFSFPFILMMMGKELYNPTDPIFMKIQISIALIVLVLTVIFRKYFYMSLNHIKSEEINDFEEVNNDTLKTDKLEKEIKKEDWLNFDIKNTSEKKEDYTFKMDEDETKEEDDIKIFMDKEIKR
ncbi:MAG: hypothetical protein WC850_02615 [Candidatus Gracilibacteria bacterium]